MSSNRWTPLDLVSDARDLLRQGMGSTPGAWPRAAAVLARQAIESSMAGLWDVRAPGLRATSMRCQLLCLRVILGDGDLAGRTGVAYDALTHAMHHHPYELAPTRDELLGWITTAWELANRVDAIEREVSRPRTN